jgi:hypothetical protein
LCHASVCLGQYVRLCQIRPLAFSPLSTLLLTNYSKSDLIQSKPLTVSLNKHITLNTEYTFTVFLCLIYSYLQRTGIISCQYQQFAVALTLWNLTRKAPGKVIDQHTGRAFVDKVLRGFPPLSKAIFLQFHPLKLDSFLPDAFQIFIIIICNVFLISIFSKMKGNKNYHVKD